MTKYVTPELVGAVKEVAQANGWDPVDLMTTIGYETGGTYNSWQKGPTTQWGQHRGLIQWGEDQRKQYGVTKDMPVREQVIAAGKYLKDRGVREGDNLLPMYAAINGGNVAAIHASDENNGGAPGTVLDKVNSKQMAAHRAAASGYLGMEFTPGQTYGGPGYESAELSVPEVVAEPEETGIVPEMKGLAGSIVKSAVMDALTPKEGPRVKAPPPMPARQMAPMPVGGQVVMTKKKKDEKKGG